MNVYKFKFILEYNPNIDKDSIFFKSENILLTVIFYEMSPRWMIPFLFLTIYKIAMKLWCDSQTGWRFVVPFVYREVSKKFHRHICVWGLTKIRLGPGLECMLIIHPPLLNLWVYWAQNGSKRLICLIVLYRAVSVKELFS